VQQVVGMADLKISSSQDDVLITFGLGSCLGVTVYDPVSRVGGMLHVMLPQPAPDLEKPLDNPYMFVDSGVPRLFLGCYSAGARKERIIVKAAGGACIGDSEEGDPFQIGRQNFSMLKKVLSRNGVLLQSFDVGGGAWRTMSLDLGTGDVRVRTDGDEAFEGALL